MNTAFILIPDFILIIFAWALNRYTNLNKELWIGIEKLVYWILFPCLLLSSSSRAVIDWGDNIPMLLLIAAVMIIIASIAYASKWILRPDPINHFSGTQTAFRFNTYIGLALAQRLGGDACVAQFALIVAFAVPLCNGAAVLALAAHNGSGFLHQLLRNPLLVATLAGLAGNLMGLTLPEPLQAVLVRMGQASVALGLMAVGAGLNLHGASDSRLLLAIVTLIKVMLLPACALWVGQAMGLPREVLQTVVLFSALPTASSAYILTVQMGGNGPLVARAVTVSTLVSILSLPMWLSWVP